MHPRLTITPRPVDHPDVEQLIAEVQQEYVWRYGGPDETPFDPGQFTVPAGAMFVGYVDGQPVAMGGWRRSGHTPEIDARASRMPAEVKRMYVRPGHQRRGYARDMLAHLETTAAAAGCDCVILETGTAQPEAMAFYESCGYFPVAKFGYYSCAPESRCYGRRLRPAPQDRALAAP